MSRRILDLDQIDFQNGDNKQDALNSFTNVSSANVGDVLTKDTNGNVLFQSINSISASRVVAKNTSTQSIQGSIFTKVLFPTEIIDSQDEFVNNTFTSKTNQSVLISSAIILTGLGSNKLAYMYIYKNNASFITTCNNSGGTGSGGITGVNLSHAIDVNIGDTIDIFVYHTDGSNMGNLTGDQMLSIIKLK